MSGTLGRVPVKSEQFVRRLVGAAASLVPLLCSAPALAGGQVVRPADDSNSRLEIKDALVGNGETTVLFWTWPDRGDPDFRNDCGKNYYTVTVRPGLSSAEPQLLARGACAGTGLLSGGLLADGSGKFIVEDRLEHWRSGQRVASRPLASLDGIGTLGLKSSEMGSHLVDVSPAGDLVMAVSVSGSASHDWDGIATVLAGLAPDDSKRWLISIEQGDVMLMPEQLWAGNDGGALLYYKTVDTTSIGAAERSNLMHVSAGGERLDIPLVQVAEVYDFMSMKPGSEEDLQKAFAHMDANRPEAIRSLAARPRDDGGFDVLYRRESDTSERDGYFLLALDRAGGRLSERAIGSVIEDHGLDRWFDFYVEGDQLVLLSKVPVTQTGVNSRRSKWGQTVVSWIGVGSGAVRSRLIPLERKYLEAAMNAGDEGQQYLEGQPGGTPVLLTQLGGVPLSLAQGWEKRRGTLRMFEATDELVAFTEYHDEQQARLAREAEREQRRARREAGQRQMQDDMAAAAGMSREEFEALSKEEQAVRMVQGGGLEAMMAAAMKQAQAAQAGMTPEQAAQMQAQLDQVQRMMQGGGMAAAAAGTGSAAVEQSGGGVASFTVDALNRGRVRFSSGNSEPLHLFIVDRKGGEVLLEKEYPGGEIDDYLSLGRYRLPAQRMGALVKAADGAVLADLSPVAP